MNSVRCHLSYVTSWFDYMSWLNQNIRYILLRPNFWKSSDDVILEVQGGFMGSFSASCWWTSEPGVVVDPSSSFWALKFISFSDLFPPSSKIAVGSGYGNVLLGVIGLTQCGELGADVVPGGVFLLAGGMAGGVHTMFTLLLVLTGLTTFCFIK